MIGDEERREDLVKRIENPGCIAIFMAVISYLWR